MRFITGLVWLAAGGYTAGYVGAVAGMRAVLRRKYRGRGLAPERRRV